MLKRINLHNIKLKLIVSSLIIFSLFVSCKKKTQVIIETEEVPEPEIEIVSEPEKFINAIILSPSSNLFLKGRDEKMHSIFTLKNNDYVQILLENENENPVKIIEDKTYLHVVYDSLDFWIAESDVALCEKTAVTLFNITLYEDAQLETVKESGITKLKFGTLVALLAENEAVEAENKASEEIYYYDTSNKIVQSAFVKQGTISSRKDDIEVLKIVEALKVTKRAVDRNTLFARADKYNPSPSVKAALKEQTVEKITYNYDEVVKNLKKQLYGVNVDELMTVDQSKDPF